MSSLDVSHQLRQSGLRVTAPRQWLAEHPHATAEQVRCGVVQRLGSVSTQTVYDVLAACTSAGLVRRIEPAGHPEAEVLFWGTCPSCQDPPPAPKPTEPDENHYQEALQ